MPHHTSVMDRFLAKVNKTDTCWLWTGRVLPHGYAVFYVDGKYLYGHRWAHETFIGPIPDRFQVDHVKERGCTNRHCVNPSHLEAVPAKVNNSRSTSVSAKHKVKTHCPQGHAYDSENTYHHTGSRHCKRCMSIRQSSKRKQAA